MDTLTHALSGALLARALTPSGDTPRNERWFGPRIPVREAVVVGFVCAALPDADALLQLVSDVAYLRGHRGITHSVILLPLWALALGALAALAFRRPRGWKRYSWLAAAALVIHIAGDVITQFGTMLFAPFSDVRVALGSVFIIDLVISGILVGGLVVSAILRRSRAPAVTALLLLPLWVAVTLTGRDEAIAAGLAYAEARGIEGAIVSAAPRPASPFNWTVIVEDGDRWHVAHLNTRRDQPVQVTPADNFVVRYGSPYAPVAMARWQQRPKFGEGADEALARAAWDRPELAFFRWFAMFPVLDHVDRDGDTTCAWFRDLRFEMPGRDSVPFRYGMCREGRDETRWKRYALEGDTRAALD